MLRYALLALAPAAVALSWWGAGAVWVFLAAAAAIAVLADWVRRGTEQLAVHAGPAIGGLLNVTFGSIAELILAGFVLLDGKTEVVQAQLIGSIIGTSLFGLGLAVLVGGIGRERLCFSRENAVRLSTLLVLLVIALLLPAVFDLAQQGAAPPDRVRVTDEEISLGISAVLILLYAANLFYTLVTHRDIFAARSEGGEQAEWSLARSLGVMIAGTAVIAWQAELVSGALEETGQSLGLSPLFLGVVVLALVGTAADLFAAVVFARQDRLSIVLGICIGSAIQVALVLAPLLVIVSWLLGTPMTLVLPNPLMLFAVAATAFIVRTIAADGDTTWFEGLVLVGIYGMLAIGFFFAAG